MTLKKIKLAVLCSWRMGFPVSKKTGDFVIKALCNKRVISKFICKHNGRVAVY